MNISPPHWQVPTQILSLTATKLRGSLTLPLPIRLKGVQLRESRVSESICENFDSLAESSG